MSGRREKERRRSSWVTLGAGAEYDVIWFKRGGRRELGNTRTGATRSLTEQQFAAVLHYLPKGTADELRHADEVFRRIDARRGTQNEPHGVRRIFADGELIEALGPDPKERS